jgi:hypothetical protein
LYNSETYSKDSLVLFSLKNSYPDKSGCPAGRRRRARLCCATPWKGDGGGQETEIEYPISNVEYRIKKKQDIGEFSGLIRAGYAELKDYKRIANCPELC